MVSSCDFDRCSIDSTDPFGAAPFVPLTDAGGDAKSVDRVDADSVGSVSDLRERDEDSEQDEQRMVARRRFSYENIDGVGDDASSDSRGKTDHDSTDDIRDDKENLGQSDRPTVRRQLMNKATDGATVPLGAGDNKNYLRSERSSGKVEATTNSRTEQASAKA
ncbi:unnamed protein product [Heligmosomoides polygyrus]|uniref:Uncharacterized protein n=1 Tax=Heligmosomoides polygyrus TaxID=6339 RepID=A0A3P8CJ55_HELPZ|nr:unnamed protein product [Heligmosomoides polygyrus]